MFIDVVSEDFVFVDFWFEGFLLLLSFFSWDDDLESGESLVVVLDEHSSIGESLEGSEDLVSSGSSVDTNVKNTFEWSSLFSDLCSVVSVHVDVVSIDVLSFDSFVDGVHLLIFEESSGKEETSAVSGSVVGEAGSETELLELS